MQVCFNVLFYSGVLGICAGNAKKQKMWNSTV